MLNLSRSGFPFVSESVSLFKPIVNEPSGIGSAIKSTESMKSFLGKQPGLFHNTIADLQRHVLNSNTALLSCFG